MRYVIALVVALAIAALVPVLNKHRLARGEAAAKTGGAVWKMSLSIQDSELADTTLFPQVHDITGHIAHALASLSGWSTGRFHITAAGIEWSTLAKGASIVNSGTHGGSFSFTWDQIASISFAPGPVMEFRDGRTSPMQINLANGRVINATYASASEPLVQAIQSVAPSKVALA